MRLYILRHGKAEIASGPDSARELTEKGKIQISEVSQHLDDVDLVVVSPYIRAQQTADIFLLNKQVGQRKESETLIPDASIAEVMSWLEEVSSQSVLLISHNPLVTELAAWLTGDNMIRFGTGNLACLEGDYIGPRCLNVSWIK